MPNINAMMCRIDMRRADTELIKKWYCDEAPRDSLNMHILKRYQYFTEAMAELALGDETAAMLTLSPLEPYCEKCARHIDMIHLRVLTAIAKNRLGDDSWRTDMERAVESGDETEMYLNYTKDVMDIMTGLRREWGLKYPEEM